MTNEFNPDWMCVCGDLTALGVVHRKDGPCYYPDKREWVGLHWNDLPEIYVGDTAFLHGAKWAEAKLKEKEHMKITGYCPVCVRPYFDCKCARWGNYMEKNQ